LIFVLNLISSLDVLGSFIARPSCSRRSSGRPQSGVRSDTRCEDTH
jgi:hypothetical protein